MSPLSGWEKNTQKIPIHRLNFISIHIFPIAFIKIQSQNIPNRGWVLNYDVTSRRTNGKPLQSEAPPPTQGDIARAFSCTCRFRLAGFATSTQTHLTEDGESGLLKRTPFHPLLQTVPLARRSPRATSVTHTLRLRATSG